MKKVLDTLLATIAVSANNTQARHWLLSGDMYAAWHPVFDGIYKELSDAKDNVAELMVQRSIIPVHNFSGYMEKSLVSDGQSVPDWRTMLSDMSKELDVIIELINTNDQGGAFDGACSSDLTSIAAKLMHYKMLCDRTLVNAWVD